jgi:hypothetical protein
MTSSAIIVVATQQISGVNAIKAIDIEVMLFLLGMFIIGQALITSGYLYYAVYRLFGGLKSVQHLVMGVWCCAWIGVTYERHTRHNRFSAGAVSVQITQYQQYIAVIGTGILNHHRQRDESYR